MSKEINHVLNSLDERGTSEYLKAYKILKSLYKANSISVIHVNIRSLAKNFYKLEELLNEMQVQPDIIAATETWLEPSRIKTVTLPGYNFFHTDALTASPNGTGLAKRVGIYIKASINATVRDQFRLELPGCEDLWIELPLKNGKQCYISVIYKHPKTNILDFQTHLSKRIEQLNKTNRKFYICGEMNIDFLKVQSNSIIKQYYDCIYSLDAYHYFTVPLELQHQVLL